MKGLGQQHLKMVRFVMFDRPFIGNKFMELGHPVLVDVHQRIEPENNSCQFKKEQVQRMPLLYVDQFRGPKCCPPCPFGSLRP